MKILRGGGLQKFLDTQRGGSEKFVGLPGGGGAPKICVLQIQHITSSYRLDGFQPNNLMTRATLLYHVVKCSLSNYYTLVHPKTALEIFKKSQMLKLFFIIKPH